MHTRDALRKGENSDRIAVLPGWEETGYPSETDRAALRLTEAVTRVGVVGGGAASSATFWP